MIICHWLMRFMRVMPCMSLVDDGLSSVKRFYSTDRYTAKPVMVVYRRVNICKFVQFSLCTIKVYRFAGSSDLNTSLRPCEFVQ